MKRFFCAICKKVKRVRRMPDDVEEHKDPSLRVGECRWHSGPHGATRARVNDRARTPHVNVKRPKAVPQPKKEKSGGRAAR